MRDTHQENICNEKTFSAEAGYIWNAPSIKLRASTYFLQFADGMNISTFYHDGYSNFVNYALSGINKLHYGIETGAELNLSELLSVNLAANIGRYYYSSRQQLTVTADNSASVVERGMIYSKNFRVPGTPQEAYGLGCSYQSPRFYANLTASYFRQQWLSFNPLRRTYAAVKDVAPGTESWRDILGQFRVPDQYCIDFSAGSSAWLKIPGDSKRRLLMLYIGLNNLLNNKRIISGGYEQLRFDIETKDLNKFPPKFFYAMGLNFSIHITLRV